MSTRLFLKIFCIAIIFFSFAVYTAGSEEITIKLLQPSYRNNIYASQELKEIEFEILLSGDVKQSGDSVQYELLNKDNQSLKAGKFDAGAIPEKIKVNIVDLPYGKYTLVASVLDREKNLKVKSKTVVRKLSSLERGNEVRIDENRNILVNNKPFFGIGLYGGFLSFYDDDVFKVALKDAIALQNVQTPYVVTMYPQPDFSKPREIYDKHRVMSIVSVENGRIYYSFALWRSEKKELGERISKEFTTLSTPSEEMVQFVRELVEAVKGEPWLLGYYIFDEPEIFNVRTDYLENYYKLLQELDPYHPVFVTNDTINGIATHGYKSADVLNPDPYDLDLDYVPNFLKKVNEVGATGKSTYVTLWHSSKQAHATQKYGTAPPYPYHVFRTQYLAAITYGAKGFSGYTSAFFIPEVEYYVGLPYVWRELRFLEKAIMAPSPSEPLKVEASTEMGKWIKEVDGTIYIIVANHKSGSKSVRISSPLLKKVENLIVMSEGREIKVENGTFTDQFNEGDVYIYTTDPEAKKFKSTRDITAEITETSKKNIKPGNLLHWARGTHLRAGKDFYAPWFEQYYYYAVNGITIDVGWYAYQWDKKSTCLELILKNKSQIGRIVLYTPNIRAYKIGVYDGENWISVVDVKDNTRDKIEHIINPINCIKMKVTVTGVRDERGPILSEIEAYEK